MRITDEVRKGFTVNVWSEDIRVHKVNSTVNGNPRYVVHFLNLNIEPSDYGKIKGLIKYRAKWFGGGYVFESYSVESDLKHMLQIVSDHYNK